MLLIQGNRKKVPQGNYLKKGRIELAEQIDQLFDTKYMYPE